MEREAEKETVAQLNFATFNQDVKSLAVGYHSGFSIYSLLNVLEAPTQQFESDGTTPGDVIICERMFSSSLVVYVSRQNPRLLVVYHIMNRSVICEHKFGHTILSVKMNRDRLIVCMEGCIHVYNLRDMKFKQMMHTICDTPHNKMGMIDLSTSGSPSLLAYPGSTTSGQVHIFDAMNLTSVNTFMAHANTLAALRFNAEGTKIATASTKGTVIRIFSVPNGTKLFEFQRGVRPCVMHSLCFSADSLYLCSSSNTETIHVYKLAKPEEPQATEASSGGWLEYISAAASAYLPVGEFLRETDFALARLPVSAKTVAALPMINGQQHLLVASTDAFIYCFRVPAEGGQCELLKQHRLNMGRRGSPPVHGEGSPSSNHASAPIRPPRSSDERNRSISSNGSPPDTQDMDEFPPMSHASG